MKQKDFQNTLRKYRLGEATPEEKKLIDEWYASMEENLQDQNIPGESELEAHFWASIYDHLKKSKKKYSTRVPVPWYATGIAASILLAVVSYYLIAGYPKIDKDTVASKQEASFSWKQETNTTTLPELIVLPDKSKVSLGPGSKLKYSSVFNETKREVYLEGEAFFEVSENAERPFFVYANEVTTKVLGTSFTVKAFQQEKKITISVKTGKVSVVANHKKEKLTPTEEIILTPNQQIVYDKEENKISKMLVDIPQVILPEEEVRRMRFEEAPIAEIFKAIEKAYGVEIVFDESMLSSCELTTIISDNDIYNRLNIICNAIGASYAVENGKIIISSAGCN